MNRKNSIATLLIAILVFSGATFAADKKDPPQTTPEGLNLIKHTKNRIVYAADDVDLGQYTKVMIVECAVAFKKNWQRDYNRNVIDLDGRITDKDVARYKEQIAAEFKKVFTEVMTKKGHEIVTEPASDVIVLRPAIINVVASAPDTRSATMSRTFVADPGQMTLYLELYDSVSSSMLAEIIDAESATRTGMMMSYSSRATNLAAVDRMLRDWANELAGHFGEVKKAD